MGVLRTKQMLTTSDCRLGVKVSRSGLVNECRHLSVEANQTRTSQEHHQATFG
jgi:hypothetical protein